jgi:aryl-alcohol dehydrogenase
VQGVPAVREGHAVDPVGMRGTCVLIGGVPAGAGSAVGHLSTLWGTTIVATLGGSARLIRSLRDRYASGRFPLDRLVEFPLDRIEDATASYEGAVTKPVRTMPH